MGDAINPSLLPPGLDAYCGYLNGQWPDFTVIAAAHPGAHLLDLTVYLANTGTGIDVEAGDASPVQFPLYVKERLAAGVWRPVGYASISAMPTLVAAASAAGIARSSYRLLSAHYGAGSHICGPTTCAFDGPGTPQCDGTQWIDHGGWDESLLADDFFDSAPAPTATGGTTLPASTDVVATWVLPGTNGAMRCQLHADGGLFSFGLAPSALRYTAYGNDGSEYDFPDPKYPGVFSYPGFPAAVRDKPFPTRYFTSMHVVSYQGVNYEAAVVVAPFDPGPILARLGTDEASLAQVANNLNSIASAPGADLGPLGARIDAIVAELAAGSDSPAVIAIQVDLAALHAKVVAVAKDLS